MNVSSIIYLFIILGLVIFIHELGHFLLAKKNGVRVVEFSIGLGPRLVSREKNGTRYSLKCIPFGGSCQMLGNDMGFPDTEDAPIEDEEHSFASKSVWSRISIIAAGPVFNFLLAFVLAVIVLGFAGSDVPIISGVIEGYPAEAAGLKEGDRIVKLNGESIHLYRDLQLYLMVHEGEPLQVTYKRDGETLKTEIVPKFDEERGGYLLGVYGGMRYRLNWYETLGYSWYELRYNVNAVVKSLGMVVTGRLPMTSFSGPVGILETVDTIVDDVNEANAGLSFGDLAMSMFLTLTNFMILISANLGVMNLLPLPALDGGRLLFLILEVIRGEPVPPEKEAIVHIAGFIFLFLFMIFVLFNDIRRLFP